MGRRTIKSLIRDEGGAIAATYALALVGLIAIAGVGYDYSRLATVDSELQNGADQAALAGVTQLDGKSGACSRAANAAAALITNTTILATTHTISFPLETACDATGNVRFWQDKDRTTAATSDANAHFIDLTVSARTVDYAFTPITGLLNATIDAAAMAGIGSSICRVPPLMLCSPNPSQAFNAAGKRGWGIQATGHGANSWSAGDFGFLEVGTGQTADLLKALAFNSTTFDCTPITGTYPETGNAQNLFNAVNTRFDIYDFSAGQGTTLAPCFSGSCPAASNAIKDLVKQNTNTNGNACKIHNSGWHLPVNQFSPRVRNAASDTAMTQYDSDSKIDAMGLPRDLCHYTSYVGGVAANQCHSINGISTDTNNRFGTGNWARGDYFNKYHAGRIPANASTMTRYETYKWELANGYVASINGSSAGAGDKQYAAPVCSTGSAGTIDRRVLTVAIVKNCGALAGGSTKVDVDEWVDVFLVEPTFDARGNGVIADSIYLEVIGPSSVGSTGGATGSQEVRRDVPYLVR